AARPGELSGERVGQSRAELTVEVAEVGEGLEPFCVIHAERLVELRARDAESLRIERVGSRNPADRRFQGAPAAPHALHDPLEHADVVPVAGPQELPVGVAAEPVDAEDARRLHGAWAGGQPVPEVVAHVIATEREHRHRIATDHADLPGNGRGRFRAHRRAEEDAVRPVEGLEHEGDDTGAARAEDERGDRYAVRLLPVRRDRWALLGQHGEARIRVRGRCARLPWPALPVHEAGGSGVSPSHHGSPEGLTATLVKIVLLFTIAVALGFVLGLVFGATPKKPRSGLIARSWPLAST